jgi:glycosyltransferase involved in cell wall biosynthesis
LPGREALWQRYPETTGKQVVLFLGRIHPKKGLPLLVEAFARVLAMSADLHLVIAGPDEAGHRAEVESLVAQRRLGPHVTFTGTVEGEDKRLLLGGAHVFVLPSHQEGDSVAVKEALAAGLPVVITRPCHFPEVAEHDAGFVVEPAVDEIAEALAALCQDRALRERMAANARPLVERSYRWEVLGPRLLERYAEVLARQRTGTRVGLGGAS